MIGLLGAALAWELAAAETNLPAGKSAVTETNAAVEKEYQAILDQDDAAQADVDKWIRDNREFSEKGAGVPNDELNRRIRQRFEPVREAYEGFLKRHPDHARGHLAYGSFLGDFHDEAGALTHWEKALALDTNNPAAYNNLAGAYSEGGKVTKAFEYFAKAIELNPLEAIYYHNFADTVYLFRAEAMGYYNLSEQAVFAKALSLYSNALRLDPLNFPFASDLAQTYYSLKPLPTEAALRAWGNALKLAHDEVEREGIYIHQARVHMLAGKYNEARARLVAVTNANYTALKQRLSQNITRAETEAQGTNAPAATPKAP